MTQRHVAATPEGLYDEFHVGQRVMSVEGFPGTVSDVLDGGPAGNTVIVRLDNGMGGGSYRESDLSALNERSSSMGAHEAEVDYPELNGILAQRPDLAPIISEREYLLGTVGARLAAAKAACEPPPFDPRTAAMVHCVTCDSDYAADSPDEFHDHTSESGTDDIDYTAAKTAGEWDLHLPLDMSTQGPPLHSQLPGYDEGFAHAQSGATREPASNDSDYRVNYNRGWADGVSLRPPNVELPKTDADDLGTDQDTESKYAGLVDFIKGSPTPSKNWAGPGHNWSFDWCRYRRESHCFLPKELNVAASDEAGYAVWTPEDRGECPRKLWEDQRKCPVGEPGPHVPNGYLDATVPWDEGGQHGGVSAPGYRAPEPGA